MVGNHPEGNVNAFLLAINTATQLGKLVQIGLEHIRVIVRRFAFYGAYQALETHAGIDVLCGQRHQGTVRLALKLHEDQIPDFDDLRVVRIHKVRPGLCAALGSRAQINVDFRAGATGSRFAHFPKIIFFRAIENAVCRHVLSPHTACLVVGGQSIPCIAPKDGDVQLLRIQAVYLRQKLPGPVNGFLLEVVPKAPIAQHFKQRVVVGVNAYFLQIVVLPADA